MTVEIKSAFCPHCGAEFELADEGERSSPDNRRFFKLIRAAKYHWPVTHAFQPRDAEHLRNWLYVEVGHCDENKITFGNDVVSVSPLMLSMLRIVADEALHATKGKGFTRIVDGALVVVTPKTSRFQRHGRPGLSQRQFNSVRDRVTALIELIIGSTAEQLLNETNSAGVKLEGLQSGEH